MTDSRRRSNVQCSKGWTREATGRWPRAGDTTASTERVERNGATGPSATWRFTAPFKARARGWARASTRAFLVLSWSAGRKAPSRSRPGLWLLLKCGARMWPCRAGTAPNGKRALGTVSEVLPRRSSCAVTRGCSMEAPPPAADPAPRAHGISSPYGILVSMDAASRRSLKAARGSSTTGLWSRWTTSDSRPSEATDALWEILVRVGARMSFRREKDSGHWERTDRDRPSR
jgi:hypothetical protein